MERVGTLEVVLLCTVGERTGDKTSRGRASVVDGPRRGSQRKATVRKVANQVVSCLWNSIIYAPMCEGVEIAKLTEKIIN